MKNFTCIRDTTNVVYITTQMLSHVKNSMRQEGFRGEWIKNVQITD